MPGAGQKPDILSASLSSFGSFPSAFVLSWAKRRRERKLLIVWLGLLFAPAVLATTACHPGMPRMVIGGFPTR